MKSGYYRVEIQTDTGRMEKGYYRVRYRMRDENGEKGITAGSLDDLKREIVNNRQLTWKIVDEKKAETTRLLDAKIQEIKNQYIKDNENLDNIIDKAKVDKKILMLGVIYIIVIQCLRQTSVAALQLLQLFFWRSNLQKYYYIYII